jgi:predicted outer membrane repeat protein
VKFPTIEKAVNRANCTIINIAAGVYNEHFLSVNHDMTIRGAGANTIIDGDSQPIFYVGFPTTTFSLSNVMLRNSADNGGALALDTDVAATVDRVIFKNNSPALWMQGGTLELSNSLFQGNNNPLSETAAISRDGNGGTLTIDSTTFKKNKATCAAAIYSATDNEDADLIITNSKFIKNTSTGPGCQGGAIYTEDPITIGASSFTKNQATMATSQGGAIYQTTGGMTIYDTTFSGNSAAQGGAILSSAGEKLTLTYNSFDNNTATVNGGGALYTASETVIINTTFSNNKAEGNGIGGGIAMLSATSYMSFATFSNNSASSGGNLAVDFSTLELKSSILNQGVPDNCSSNGGALTSKGSNLSSDTSCAAYLNAAKDQNNKDPLLGVLANNGGTTRTHALLPGSPAINKSKNCQHVSGTPVTADQRHLPRPFPNPGKCDIGAHENQ